MKESIFISETVRRMFAGIWFAVAAAIPVGYYFAFNPFNGNGLPILGNSLFFTAALPVLFRVFVD